MWIVWYKARDQHEEETYLFASEGEAWGRYRDFLDGRTGGTVYIAKVEESSECED